MTCPPSTGWPSCIRLTGRRAFSFQRRSLSERPECCSLAVCRPEALSADNDREIVTLVRYPLFTFQLCAFLYYACYGCGRICVICLVFCASSSLLDKAVR